MVGGYQLLLLGFELEELAGERRTDEAQVLDLLDVALALLAQADDDLALVALLDVARELAQLLRVVDLVHDGLHLAAGVLAHLRLLVLLLHVDHRRQHQLGDVEVQVVERSPVITAQRMSDMFGIYMSCGGACVVGRVVSLVRVVSCV